MLVCRNRDGRYQEDSTVIFSGDPDPWTLEAVACIEAFALAEAVTELELDGFCGGPMTKYQCLESRWECVSLDQWSQGQF